MHIINNDLISNKKNNDLISNKKNDFAEIFKNVVRYRSENNFVGPSK